MSKLNAERKRLLNEAGTWRTYAKYTYMGAIATFGATAGALGREIYEHTQGKDITDELLIAPLLVITGIGAVVAARRQNDYAETLEQAASLPDNPQQQE